MGWSFCLLFQDIFLMFSICFLVHVLIFFVNHFVTFFNNFLLHSFPNINNILILSIVDRYSLVFHRPTSFSFTLNVYILSIVYLYLQLWCPFEGDLNIICFVLNRFILQVLFLFHLLQYISLFLWLS